MWGPIDLAKRVLRALPDGRRISPDSRETVADAFERSVRQHAERPAILHGESGEPRAVTFEELDAMANRVACGLWIADCATETPLPC